MTIELKHVISGNTMRCSEYNLKSGMYSIFIPSGTNLWRVGISTYLFDAPCTASARFDNPPAETGVPIGEDTRNTLERLWGGDTLEFYSPPGSGTLSISAPESTNTFITDRDRWLYINFDFPSGKALSFSSQITVKAVPTDVEVFLQQLHKAGLSQALYLLSGADNEQTFLNKVLDTGTWQALLNLRDELKDKP